VDMPRKKKVKKINPPPSFNADIATLPLVVG
jgi:hypothetical protein